MILSFTKSNKFRINFFVISFLLLILFRQMAHEFAISIGYMYILLITLAASWYGLKGGLTAAIISCLVFTVEVLIYKGWSGRQFVYHGILLRFLAYLVNGIVIGYIVDMCEAMSSEKSTIKDQLKKIHNHIRENLLEIFPSNPIRQGVIVMGFILLIVLRQAIHSFGVSLGYLYILLISIAGLWFGVKGGIITALVSTCIFMIELTIFADWPARDLVFKGMFLRFFAFFTEGVLMGYLYEIENKLIIETKVKKELEDLAYHDELTKCINYRWIMQLLEKEMALAKRYVREMTVVMIDIDHFKKINDEYNHQVGNAVLKALAQDITENLREVDSVGRFGGDEFLLILPEASAEQILSVMNRIKFVAENTKIDSVYLEGKQPPLVTFSAGVASFPTNGRTTNELLEAVDKALYLAKNSGRNKIKIEKRRWVRLKPKQEISVQISEGAKKFFKQPLEIMDVSQRGMLVYTEEKIPLQEDLQCRIALENGRPTDYKCRVVHEDKLANHLYRIGLFMSESFLPVTE
ncbi:MAG: diguanylate cyclase [bacterium]|nr:diguanylate cyclase [bacterium]MDD5354686.1 diguanylate cyclase [bacterium]MDD5756417.1 diguanylate cyclase [bacterium]